jgi:hypothetical protein
VKLTQVFSICSATSGDGRTKGTAIFFKKAKTHHEAIEAFYNYLESENIVMFSRQQAALEGGFLFDAIATDRGTIWVKYRISLP